MLPVLANNALTFRRATSADVAAIEALVNDAYRAEGRGWTSERALVTGKRIDVAQLQALLQTPDLRLVVACHGAEIVSCILVEPAGADAHIGLFAVAPAHQASGIGARFLTHAEQLAQESGARRAVMQVVTQRSDLIAFYERRGYRRTGEPGAYPVDAGVGTPRVPGLTIATLEKYLDESR